MSIIAIVIQILERDRPRLQNCDQVVYCLARISITIRFVNS